MSLETTFKTIGTSIKSNLESRGIIVSSGSGFKTILLKIFDLIDTKANTNHNHSKSNINDYTRIVKL